MENLHTNNKLPVIEIFYKALSLPKKHFATLLRFGVPLLLLALLIVPFPIIYSSFFSQEEEVVTGVNTVGFIIIAILFLASLVMAIIGCHRTFLLRAEDVSNTKAFRWTGREMRYVGWWILIGLCSSLIALPFMGLVMLFVTGSQEVMFENRYIVPAMVGLVYIPIYYVVARWSLVLPATAIGMRHRTLSWSWDLSSGNGWRLTLLVGFIPFVTDLFFSFLPSFDSVFYSFLLGSVWLIVGVVEIGLLSLSYAYLSENISEPVQ